MAAHGKIEGDFDAHECMLPRPARFSWDAATFSILTLIAGPALWLTIWYFAFYLSSTDPSNGGLTAHEKWDTLQYLMPVPAIVSALLAPIVFIIKTQTDKRKLKNGRQ